MNDNYLKPLPIVNEDNKPFWDGCKSHRLMLQKCCECNHIRHTSPICPKCLSSNNSWVASSGRGHLYTWIIVHQRYSKAFEKDLPYNVAIVELEEGPKLVSNLVEMGDQELRAALPVEVVWDDISEEFTLPRFRPTN